MSTLVRLFAAAVGMLAAGATTAQTIKYRDVTTTHLPPGLAGACMDAASGDADGDGDLDLALAMEFEPNILLLNDGTGAFEVGTGRLPYTIHDSEDVAFADFDNDGDLDLVLVSEDDRTNELYLNDGTGRFSDASPRIPVDDVSNALAVLDLNRDGALDILIGNVGVDRVLINDGHASFRDETTAFWPQDGMSSTQDLELADVDADGDLDVIVGNEGQNQLFLNDEGQLVDVTARSLPERSDETREIRAVDIDGDGDLDLVVANVTFVMSEPPRDYVLLNDGAGIFSMLDPAAFPEGERDNFTVQAVDLDGDGDTDIVLPSSTFPRFESEFLVLVTDESGRPGIARAADIDIRDVDGDGDNDAVVRDSQREYTIVNDDGRLVVAGGADVWERLDMFDDIDSNGDGSPDLAVAGVQLGQRPGAASPASGNGGDSGRGAEQRDRFVRLADIDRDGDIDVIMQGETIIEASGDYLVLRNDGNGRFAATSAGAVLPPDVDGNGFDIEVADFDGDGTLDLFLCNRASAPDPGLAAAETGGLQRLLRGERGNASVR